MSTHSTPDHDRHESPDPGSHVLNIYDNQNDEGEWFDGGEDDDMDFEPTTDASEDTEFFEPSEDADIIFHGNCLLAPKACRIFSKQALQC